MSMPSHWVQDRHLIDTLRVALGLVPLYEQEELTVVYAESLKEATDSMYYLSRGLLPDGRTPRKKSR
jgi:hypothetical protein